MYANSKRCKFLISYVLLGGHLGERVVLFVPPCFKINGYYSVVGFQLNISLGGALAVLNWIDACNPRSSIFAAVMGDALIVTKPIVSLVSLPTNNTPPMSFDR